MQVIINITLILKLNHRPTDQSFNCFTVRSLLLYDMMTFTLFPIEAVVSEFNRWLPSASILLHFPQHIVKASQPSCIHTHHQTISNTYIYVTQHDVFTYINILLQGSLFSHINAKLKKQGSQAFTMESVIAIVLGKMVCFPVQLKLCILDSVRYTAADCFPLLNPMETQIIAL